MRLGDHPKNKVSVEKKISEMDEIKNVRNHEKCTLQIILKLREFDISVWHPMRRTFEHFHSFKHLLRIGYKNSQME